MSSTISSDMDKQYDRKPLKVGGIQLASLAFSTLGVIYSDIGTSPLYVLGGIWAGDGEAPSQEDVIGGVSAIIWALTIIPLVKYVGFALYFGTSHGEGGPFALYTRLFPEKEISNTYSRSLTRDSTMDPNSTYPQSSPRLAKLAPLKWPLLIWTLFGTALTMSDGILTPAVSVVTAVGGIAVAKTSVLSSVVGISIAFIVALFLVQPFGTGKVSYSFAPVTFIWLALLGATGIYNITYFPGIWRAWDPSRAVLWFVRTGNYDYLAGVLLAITGSEALFANLGQFNAASIRLAFAVFVYPMLVLAYLGQGARLCVDGPDVYSNIFYLTIPGPVGGGLYWVMFIFAILASLVASQAMITACFSLIHQLIGMKSFPALRIRHTSTLTYGQIYIPVINWLLMIGAIAVVGGFGSSAALTNAYGFAVATVLIVTTTLIALSFYFVKNQFWVFGVAFLLFFGFFDGLFWGAALKKVPLGAWFPLGLGAILAALMAFWTWGRQLEDSFDDNNSNRLSSLFTRTVESPIASKTVQLPKIVETLVEEDEKFAIGSSGLKETEYDLNAHDLSSSALKTVDQMWLRKPSGELLKLERIPVMAMFHRNDHAGKGVPHSFAAFLERYPALPQIVIFLTTIVVGVPHVEEEDRYVVNKVRSLEGFFSATMRVGYLDNSTPTSSSILPQLLRLSHPDTHALLVAAAAHPTHVLPSYTIRSKQTSKWAPVNWLRRFFVEELYGRGRVIFPERPAASGVGHDDTLQVVVAASI